MKIHESYKPLYLSDKRYLFLTGGRASLKSTTIHDFASRLTYQKNHGILITRYTMASAEKSIIPEFENVIKLNGSFPDFHKSGNKYINKHTGSFILFSGIKTSSGDQTANLKSLAGIDTWIIDEGEDFTDEATFDDIDDSIRGNWNQNRVIWIQNPSTVEHFIHKRWMEGHTKMIEIEGVQIPISNHPDVEAIHTTYHIAQEMGYLSKSFLNKVEEIKRNNPNKYKHKYLGGWLDKAEGVIFENWKEGEFDESLPYIFGMDFGVVDPTTLIKVSVDNKRKKLYVKECFYESNLRPSSIMEKTRNFINENDLIIADSAEPLTINEMQYEGFNILKAIKGADSIRKGIRTMLDYEIIVDPESHNLKKELNNYIWNDKKSETPVDDYNHGIDSIRYALVYLLKQGQQFVI